MGHRTYTAFVFALALGGLGLTTQAQADGFYYGGGVSFSHSTSSATTIGLRFSEDDYAMFGGLAGYGWNVNGITLSAEASLDVALSTEFVSTSLGVACDNGAQGRYFCTHDATLRLRGVTAFDFGNGYQGLVSAGYGRVWGDVSTSPLTVGAGSSDGYTLGLGVERASANGLTHRVELIYDRLDNPVTSPAAADDNRTFEAVTLSYRILFGR